MNPFLPEESYQYSVITSNTVKVTAIDQSGHRHYHGILRYEGEWIAPLQGGIKEIYRGTKGLRVLDIYELENGLFVVQIGSRGQLRTEWAHFLTILDRYRLRRKMVFEVPNLWGVEEQVWTFTPDRDGYIGHLSDTVYPTKLKRDWEYFLLEKYHPFDVL